MKLLLCLFLAVLTPVLCRGEGVTLSDSSDWRPLSDAQKAAFLKAFSRPEIRLLDASVYTGGGGVGAFVSMPLVGTVDKARFDGEVDGFIKGVTGTGATLLDRQPANVASLPGVSTTFQGQANGKAAYILAYVLFTDHEMYAFSLYTTKPLARTDPMLTSYEARIKLDPSVVPAPAGQAPGFSLPTLASLDSYHLGRFSGVDLLVLGGAAVLIALIAKFVPGR